MDAFAIETNADTNVLCLQFRNLVSAHSMAAQIAVAEAQVAQLHPGFTVIVDLTELESMELDCVPHVTRLMDLFLAAEIGQVIRIIPDASKDIGFTLLSLTHYRGRVPIKTISSRTELPGTTDR